MKNLFSLIALIACFSILNTTTVVAQDSYRNHTDCDFEIKVAYGDPDDCDEVEGFITIIAGATSSGTVGIPNGKEILYFKGRYVGTTGAACAFLVGQDCSGYAPGGSFTCDEECGNYNVSFNSSLGFRLFN